MTVNLFGFAERSGTKKGARFFAGLTAKLVIDAKTPVKAVGSKGTFNVVHVLVAVFLLASALAA